MVTAILTLLKPVELFPCTLVSRRWRAIVLGDLDLQEEVGGWEPNARQPQRRTFLAGASRNGCLQLVKWLVSCGCPWDEAACAEAARGAHVETLTWLQDAGCPWSSHRCLVAATDGGHIDLVRRFMRDQQQQYDEAQRYRLTKRCTKIQEAIRLSINRAIQRADHRDCRNVLQLILEDVHACSSMVWFHATATCNLGLLDWLHGRGHGIPDRTSMHAAFHGHIPVLEWLRTKGRPLCVEEAYGSVIMGGHAHVIDCLPLLDSMRQPSDGDPGLGAVGDDSQTVRRMLQYGRVVGTKRLAVVAAYGSHLDVLVRIKESGAHMPRLLTLAAAYMGHTHVVSWAASVGVRMSSLVTGVAAMRGHQETARFCKQECGIEMLWDFNEPLWKPNSVDQRDFMPTLPKHDIVDMALSHSGPDTAERLARDIPHGHIFGKRVQRLAADIRDPRIVPHITGHAGYAPWKKAASKCDITAIEHMCTVRGLPHHWIAQEMFLKAGPSRYGWYPVFRWLVEKGRRCADSTMVNLIGTRGHVNHQAIRWAADRWCPWPRSERGWLYCLGEGSALREWVLMSDEDPLVLAKEQPLVQSLD